MMKIIEQRALRGGNYYHRLPVIFIELDLEELEEKPSNLFPNMVEQLHTMMPGLYEHTCSPGVVGGFFQRVERGTWAGHMAEHVAIELQNMIGHDVTYGKTITREPKGTYYMVYRYLNEAVGLRAGQMAVSIINNLFQEQLTEIQPLIDELKCLEAESKFGPSTQAIVDEAVKRGIPFRRLNEYSHVQLGTGKYQRQIEATLMDDTSSLGVEIAADKDRTKEILDKHGIPTPQGREVDNLEDALKLANRIGYPVVLKPLSGNHGRGVILNIQDDQELTQTFQQSSAKYSDLILEKYLNGFDFRLMVINYQFQAAALRCPARVIGDGKASIAELVESVNQSPQRGEGHENNLTKIKIDSESQRLLKAQGYSLETVLKSEQVAYLKATANISSGGTAIDVTDRVHPSIKMMAERIARLVNLNVMGIDLIAPSIEKPLDKQTAGVVEVNAGPGFRIHLQPSEGQPRNIAKSVVDMLFPECQPHSIPICAVTGTNGKTTTTRLIAHILSHHGKIVGYTSTDAVIINNTPILEGDYSGPGGAEAVLTDKTVEAAVLEVARGGILRRGLGYQTCDVGVLLNVSSDHLGYGGIDSLEQLARLKSSVTESVKRDGYAVYNADDPLVVERARLSNRRAIYFSKNPKNPILIENLVAGSLNVTLLNQDLILQKSGGNISIGRVADFPISFDGLAQFNIENMMAAVAATYAMGVSEEDIRTGLVSFSPSIGQSPGRMNTIDIGEFKVVIDYGHNPGAIRATGSFFQKLMPGRKIRLASGVGNRRTEDILEYGHAVAEYFDAVVLCDPCARTRELGETAKLVQQGLLEGGMAESAIEVIYNEPQATIRILEMAQPGDLIVIQANDIELVTQQVLAFKEAYLNHPVLM